MGLRLLYVTTRVQKVRFKRKKPRDHEENKSKKYSVIKYKGLEEKMSLLVFFVESSVTTHMCPICQATLRYRDSRPRIRKKEGGLKDQLIIRRFYCKNCHSYHNELPDCLVPYKHYETEMISGVLDGVVQPDDLNSEDYSSFATMIRWLQWFRENHERINGYLRTILIGQVAHLGTDYSSPVHLV